VSGHDARLAPWAAVATVRPGATPTACAAPEEEPAVPETTPVPSAADIARRLSDDARALNYATLPFSGYPGLEWPSDAYETLGALAEATRRLVQATDQIAAFLREQKSRPGLVDVDAHGGRSRPDQAVAMAISELGNAAIQLGRAARTLDRAQQETSGLAVDTPDTPDDAGGAR
jgi:hypothetical protein